MLTYESKVHVDRPPAAVFPYLIEPQRQALWSDVPMKQLTSGPLATGSRMEVTFGMGPIRATVGLEISDLEPGRRMAFRSFSGPIRWDGEYSLTPGETGGTELHQEGTLAFTGLWRLIEPIAGAEIKSGEVKELERLKAVVEEREPA
ncbi:MAG TPA: SRPBCC family protein [Candidatus Limnocylindria bacterium]